MAVRDELASPVSASAPDRDTILAGTTRPDEQAEHADDDHLGMRLSPSIEDHARRIQRAAERSTIPWPPPSSRGGKVEVTDFGPYVLMEEIGRGGMGVVYKARQKGLDRIVALKMILSSHLASPEQVERFYAEARAAARVQDPRIVGIHDVGQIGGQHYFAMEFVAGPSLAQWLQVGPLSPEDAARCVMIVAKAIGRLHAQGIVHRDLKPSNILLDEAGLPCVTDFGLAKMLSTDGPATRTGAIVGTPSYMSPEQAAGHGGDVGPLSDVYSLGAILYELLTGTPPFDEANPLDTLVQVLEGEPSPPGQLRLGLPRDLELICLKCLEKSPESRYVSATDLADDLERFLRGEPVEARRLGVWPRLARWARREPALVSRLSTLVICGAVLQIDRAQILTQDPTLNGRIMIVLGLGIGASLIFQTLLNRERFSNLARYIWATADVILFTSLITFSDGLTTPLVAGYFLLVTASGLWFREQLVWYTTTLAVGSYGLMAGFDLALSRAGLGSAQAHILVMIGLIVTGFVVAYQVTRVRALSRFYEHRPLP